MCVEDIRKFAEVDVPHENVGARTQVRAQAWPNAHEKRMNENQDTAQSKHLSFLSVWIGLQTADALRPRQHTLLSVCKALRDAQSQAKYCRICDELAAMGKDSWNALGQLLFSKEAYQLQAITEIIASLAIPVHPTASKDPTAH